MECENESELAARSTEEQTPLQKIQKYKTPILLAEGKMPKYDLKEPRPLPEKLTMRYQDNDLRAQGG